MTDVTQERMALVFNEWARQYAEDPEGFDEILDASGNPVTEYGERAATTFRRIARGMDAQELLPVPADV